MRTKFGISNGTLTVRRIIKAADQPGVKSRNSFYARNKQKGYKDVEQKYTDREIYDYMIQDGKPKFFVGDIVKLKTSGVTCLRVTMVYSSQENEWKYNLKSAYDTPLFAIPEAEILPN